MIDPVIIKDNLKFTAIGTPYPGTITLIMQDINKPNIIIDVVSVELTVVDEINKRFDTVCNCLFGPAEKLMKETDIVKEFISRMLKADQESKEVNEK